MRRMRNQACAQRKDHVRTQQGGHLQAKERALARTQIFPHLDLWLLASGTVGNIDVQKDAQYHWSSEECKLKPQWDITSHLSEQLPPINQQQLPVRLWRKENLHALLVRMQIGAATVENSMELPQKIKNGMPYNTAIPLVRIYQKKLETGKSQRGFGTKRVA